VTSSRIWDSVTNRCRTGNGASRLTVAPDLDSRSQENQPNQTAASGRALGAPRCGGRSLFGPLLEEPGREGPDGIISA